MTSQELMNGQVPQSPVFIQISAVPPILPILVISLSSQRKIYFIKLSVSKSCQLSLDVENILECSKEEQNPADS